MCLQRPYMKKRRNFIFKKVFIKYSQNKQKETNE